MVFSLKCVYHCDFLLYIHSSETEVPMDLVICDVFHKFFSNFVFVLMSFYTMVICLYGFNKVDFVDEYLFMGFCSLGY